MNIEIPLIPVGIVTLLAFFGPYAVAPLNAALPFVSKPWQKKVVSIVVALALAAVVIVLYIGLGGALPDGGWAAVAVWSVVIVAASYAYVTKPTAAALERRVENAITT